MVPSDFLVEPSELERALANGALLIDARKPGEFKTGHIPGAMPLSTYEMLVQRSSLDGLRTFAQAIADRFSSIGVRLDRPVVVYDETTGMRAARELWMLEMIGHRRARMLHGGLAQWKAEGNPVLFDTELTTVRQTRIQVAISTGSNIPIDELARRSNSPSLSILDVRDDLEWAGKDNTPCCKRRGHIPNAIHIEWTNFLAGGRYKSPGEIMDILMANKVTPHGELALYCHRGARSANTYYALKYAGLNGGRNFIGSWHEWSSREDLPVVVPK